MSSMTVEQLKFWINQIPDDMKDWQVRVHVEGDVFDDTTFRSEEVAGIYIDYQSQIIWIQ